VPRAGEPEVERRNCKRAFAIAPRAPVPHRGTTIATRHAHVRRAWVAGLPGAEQIDKLSQPFCPGVEVADCLLADRRVIVPVKSLETDTASKVQEVLQKHENRPEYPVFYSDWPLECALAYLPDREAIRTEIYERVTRSIERAFKKADHQVAGTKRAFSCTPRLVSSSF